MARVNATTWCAIYLAARRFVQRFQSSANSNQKDYVLINNSGQLYMGEYEDCPDEEFLSTAKVNLFSPLLLSKVLLSLLKHTATKEHLTRIINITSIAGNMVLWHTCPSYMLSKVALIHMTKDIAQKHAKYNINVNSISPGMFESQLMRDSLNKEEYEQLGEMIPLHGLGNPMDIAGIVICLASEAGPYITGTNVVVDSEFLIKE
ncbi:hypothetical protein FBU59_001627 [Linderina macrospora]|uniref:Uncharacterized protein n=1 Tax=Linderina macrospora TaxID=4868 RepID=A0ACC1JDS4_9FUNG|nr:hypothetical protein FBU59_001627 [Linderina macrospora]